MRLSITLLTTALALLLGVSNASAYRVDMEAFNSDDTGVTGTPYAGTNLQVGDFLKIIVDFDSEGEANISILGFGEVFDDSSFTYRPDLSTTTSYLLYTGGKNPYLIANAVCGGYGVPTQGDGCTLFGYGTPGLIPDQVGIAHNSSSATLAGVPAATAVGGEELVTLVFEVANVSAGSADFTFDFDLSRGGILQLGDGSRVPLGLGSDITVSLPEPTVALLSFAALTTVVAVRRRRNA